MHQSEGSCCQLQRHTVGHMDKGSHPNISHQSESLPGTYAGQCDHRMSRRPESLCIVNENTSVKSTESHCCLIQETCSFAQDKRAVLYRLLTEGSAASCGTKTLILLRAERTIKQSPRSVIARGRLGTCLLDTDALV
ncbi:hypothetical protein TNCV_3884391 [Trichonephila clavipes]|nr:hypothetical protein TNCV_3884391 [Trichonephila clavipes]